MRSLLYAEYIRIIRVSAECGLSDQVNKKRIKRIAGVRKHVSDIHRDLVQRKQKTFRQNGKYDDTARPDPGSWRFLSDESATETIGRKERRSAKDAFRGQL